jgi:hypothetical protein
MEANLAHMVGNSRAANLKASLSSCDNELLFTLPKTMKPSVLGDSSQVICGALWLLCVFFHFSRVLCFLIHDSFAFGVYVVDT